jgi:NAD(P)-dependent dehydrogenase (short-subunit alcohol dehydrogenase family)
VQRLERRTALVTGAASGIGLAIAEALVAEGAEVVLTDWDAVSLERECSRLGARTLAYRLDVTDRGAWKEVRRVAEAAFGPVEILVNNAGVAPDWNDLADMPVEHFDTLIAIMLTGVFNGIHTFGAAMRDLGEGHIVNMASLIGLAPGPKQGAYVAAKSGVIGLSEVLRAEMEPYGVGVSVVCPARVRTNLLVGSNPPHRSANDGLDPALVATSVLHAIRDNELYVITNGEHKAIVEQRTDELLGAFDRAGPGRA